MLRYVVVSGLAALAVGGCDPCNYQACVTRYSPYYGYYADCTTVVDECRNRNQDRSWCWSDDCRGSSDQTGTGGATSASRSSGAGGTESPDGSAPNSSRVGSESDNPDGHFDTDAGVGKSLSGVRADAGIEGTTSGDAGGASGGSATGNVLTGRIPRLNFSCVRDTQCGAGECASGICYLACESDADCGTGDRCSVETGRRLCMPDPNPPVRCDESAVCPPAQTCVNGACHDPCTTDTDCVNLADRCLSSLCFPDRRPIAECVLDIECPADLVCLDSRCVTFGGD